MFSSVAPFLTLSAVLNMILPNMASIIQQKK
jgi:hypothetical protein